MTASVSRTEQAATAARAFVEEYGLYIERKGRLPRMAGRILGQLLIDPEPQLSQAQLCQALQASAGAVSSMLRLLGEAGFVKRGSIPGVRKDFYRLADDSWGVSLAHGVDDAVQFREITETGLAHSADLTPDARARLEEMQRLAELSEEHSRRLLEAWQDFKRSRS